jgi:type I restriction enzyme M protein
VIGLPANLFYGASIPATVLVFKKCRKDDEDILFIDASKEFDKEKNQNKLTNDNIEKIFDTYKTRKEIDKYSHRASIKEVRENNYNLNISRYVDVLEEEMMVDIKEVAVNLKELHTNELTLQNKIGDFCDELKVNRPF